MRQLVRYESEEQARILGDALFADGIEVKVDDSREGGWLVWIQNETDVPRARDILAEYERDPGGSRFAAATEVAKTKRKEREKAAAKDRNQTVRLRERWAAQSSTSIGPVSIALILCSAVVAVLTKLDIGNPGASAFTFAGFTIVDDGRSIEWSGLDDIMSGQVWRLVTPIFLHGGFLHILFNMWWLKDLGSMIERLQSSLFLLVFVLVVAIVSNGGQYFVSQHPLFGGMSGVNYALLGYIWIRSRVDPTSGYAISGRTVVWMLAWFAICFTGLVGAVANTAHTVGLLMGCGFALLVWKGPKFLRR